MSRVNAVWLIGSASSSFSSLLNHFSLSFRMALARAIEQTYYFPELDIDVFPVFTHTPSRTAMRGPSEIEASFIAETVLAHAAHAARRTPDDMRALNLFPMDKLINVDGTGIPISEWTIPRLWEELKTTSKYYLNMQINLIRKNCYY